MQKSPTKSVVANTQELKSRIEFARGIRPAEVVIRGAHWLDVFSGQWRTGDVALASGVVIGVGDTYEATEVIDARGMYVVPGFIDAHVHIESCMMTPARFAEAVLPRGTTTAIWDPHEITNVRGKAGLDWALNTAKGVAVDIFVMVPSCVPSTSPSLALETSGATLLAKDLLEYVEHPRVLGLAEMMNWPGLLAGDDEVLQKLQYFQEMRRDGHCPGLSGKSLNAYAVAGIHSCHESTTASEADEKLSKGIHVLIREGSCAKDADALLPLLTAHSSATVGFCSDDRNPLDIEEAGHLDCIVNKGLKMGRDPVDLFRAASFAAATMYGLGDRGAVAPGYLADLVLVAPVAKDKNIDWRQGITVRQVWKRGKVACPVLLADAAKSSGKASTPFPGANLNLGSSKVTAEDFRIPTKQTASEVHCRVIGVRSNQIVTDPIRVSLGVRGGSVIADASRDILKIAVFERHHGTGRRGVALVQGFGLKNGAIATSINHDCHNVIVTGSSDELMAEAVKELQKIDGGIVVVAADGRKESLALPIGGLMTAEAPGAVSEWLRKLKQLARSCGCVLDEPFLQLSFLALPVIPSLKITDRGLVDGTSFQIISVVEDEAHV